MMTKQQIIDSLNSEATNISNLKQMSFAYIRIIEHLNLATQKETRDREKARIKIALKHINKWFNEYDN